MEDKFFSWLFWVEDHHLHTLQCRMSQFKNMKVELGLPGQAVLWSFS